MRYVRFRHRRTRFTSLQQINQGAQRVRQAYQYAAPQSLRRFSVSRRYRFATRSDLLIPDGMRMHKLSSTEAQDLCEILEERSISKSTTLTTQLPLEHYRR